MTRVRIDIDELLRLRNALRRVGAEQLTMAQRLRRLENDVVGQLLRGSPAELPNGRARSPSVYRLVERLRRVSLRLEFVVSPSYGRLSNEVQAQLVELAKQTQPDSFDLPYSWSRLANAAVAGALVARLGAIVGDWWVRDARPSPVYALPAAPPTGLLGANPAVADLFRRLGTLRPGQVEVIPVVSSHDNGVRYLVLIRGIGPGNDTPNNLSDAVLASRSPESSHSLGVLAAMAKAGVPRGAEVMLVGHSQGGITAMNLAASGSVNGSRGPSGHFRITHVLTAGSPIGNKEALPGTTVLAVENTGDMVPDLDGEEEASRLGRSVYRFNRGDGYGEAHGLATGYLPELTSAAFVSDPRVERYLASASPFLAASPVAPSRFDLRYGKPSPRFVSEGGKPW